MFCYFKKKKKKKRKKKKRNMINFTDFSRSQEDFTKHYLLTSYKPMVACDWGHSQDDLVDLDSRP